MPTYAYTARDMSGEAQTGFVSARDIGELREMLRNKELYLTDVRQHGDAGSESGSRMRVLQRKTVKIDDMVVMSRQLATLVKAGLPINEALYSTAAQTESPLLAETLKKVRLDVLTGSSLTSAMREHPNVFTELYVSLVEAGEAGGVLEETLETAAQQFDKEAELRAKVKSAFVYPILVISAAVFVVAFMLIFIVPAFVKVYDQFHAELPAITQLLVFMSNIVVRYWWMVLIGIIAAVIGLRYYAHTPRGRKLYDQIKLKMPLLGKLNRKIAIARFTQTLAAVTKAGVPILKALTVSANTSGNVVIMEAVMLVVGYVKEGAAISIPLEQTGEFPHMVTRMISAGETSGNLDEMLEEVTKFYDRDIEYTVSKLTKLLEPVMTVAVGGVVLFVLLALYMPVFNLSNVIRR